MPSRVPPRLRLLRALERRPHRYDRLRALAQSFSLAALAAIPLTGLARVDLARGEHRLLFAPAPLVQALGGVLVAIALLYAVTFLSNVAAGRLFCGWGCPVSELGRLGERVDLARDRASRFRARLRLAAFALALLVATFAWWADPLALAAGPARILSLAWGAILAALALLYVHARAWRWGFCTQACPIGLYYSFVSPARWFGVHFRNAASACIACDACDQVCPVDLAPRDLLRPVPARGGLSVHGAPGRNHCLECGDCVRACELVLARRVDRPVPLKLGWHRGAQREEAESGPGAPGAGEMRRSTGDPAALAAAAR